jgi:hypothetical protein
MADERSPRRSLRCLLGYHNWIGMASRDGRRSVCGRCGRVEYDGAIEDFSRRISGH